MGFNVVVLSGRLTADPEIRMGTNDTKIARYTLAVDREKRKNTERKADFIPCVALGKNAEFVEKFLKKGMKINIRGKWQTGSYTNQNGEKIYTNDCFVETHEFAESKKSQSEEQSQPPVPSPEQDTSGFMDMPSIMDDELPFN